MNIVIIGGGASGLTTASNIRKYDEESQIIVLTTQKHVAYSPCAIPYVIGGHIDSFEDIIMHKPGEYMRKNIRILTESTVTDIDHDNTELVYEDKTGVQKLKYDKLVIATGGKPLIPPIPGKDLQGVFKVRTVDDGEEILEYANHSKNVVLVGGGAIGLELGSELANKGLKVTIAEMMPQLFPRSFDKEMSDMFQNHLQDNNITILTGSAVESINGTTKVESVTIDGEETPADMVILSTGVRPETELAESIGCELGKFAIKVNNHMETSLENVYAAGDCVEVENAITGEITLSPLGTTAVRQGIILAKNLAGYKIEFQPVLNSTVSQIGNMEMGAVGITQQEAENLGIDVVVSNIESLSRARYYPGSKPLFIKLICKLDGTIIGCQMFGQEAVAERVDTMTTIISQKLKCDDVVSLEFSYAPPVSTVTDPIAKAAEKCFEQIQELQSSATEEETESIEEETEDSEIVTETSTEKTLDDTLEETTEEISDENKDLIQESKISDDDSTEEESTTEEETSEEEPNELDEELDEEISEDESEEELEKEPDEEISEDESEEELEKELDEGSDEDESEEELEKELDEGSDEDESPEDVVEDSVDKDDDEDSGLSFTQQLRQQGLIDENDQTEKSDEELEEESNVELEEESGDESAEENIEEATEESAEEGSADDEDSGLSFTQQLRQQGIIKK